MTTRTQTAWSLVSSPTAGLPVTLLGPALVGASMGLSLGPAAAGARAALLPAVILGVAVLMVPALYIGAALLGIAPAAREVLSGVRTALVSTGTVLAGLSPALAFLVVASTRSATAELLGAAVVLLGVAIGLRSFYKLVFAQVPKRSGIPLFVGWSAVSIGIGAQLFQDALVLSTGGGA